MRWWLCFDLRCISDMIYRIKQRVGSLLTPVVHICTHILIDCQVINCQKIPMPSLNKLPPSYHHTHSVPHPHPHSQPNRTNTPISPRFPNFGSRDPGQVRGAVYWSVRAGLYLGSSVGFGDRASGIPVLSLDRKGESEILPLNFWVCGLW